ncbi:MAG: RRXRR domain-containing protein, partial [Nostoc sp.]
MLRVPVLTSSGKPLMPTKASRARRWLKEGKAKVIHNDLGIFQIQLVFPH